MSINTDDDSEAVLETYQVAHAEDLLAQHMVGAILAGLSTRRCGAALEPVGAAIEADEAGTSKSLVSRRFVTATAHQFASLMEGNTENKVLVTRLLADLRDRGLDVRGGVLFVDGSKALTKGIPAVFGDKAVIHRCRIHKERNVTGHLPDIEHAWVRTKLRRGWANPDPAAARAELDRLARALQRKHPGAASSLREGLAETLTVTRLGIDGALLKTVFSTNPVESMIEIVREHASNVKRWRDGEMTLRWAAAGMESARSQFSRVKACQQLPQLAAALEAATVEEPGLLALRVTA
ncbi:MAG: hypothetical protein GXP36_00305 [Actinobacteria bacterium]|nr:hypothetical protein [Actinomycetota bacterium]